MKIYQVTLPDDLAAMLESEMARSGLSAQAILAQGAFEIVTAMAAITEAIEMGWRKVEIARDQKRREDEQAMRDAMGGCNG